MAEDVSEAETPIRTGISLPTARETAFAGFVFLLVLGAVFYLWWGLRYDGWTDNGVYAVTITLVAFGLAGMLVTAPSSPRSA